MLNLGCENLNSDSALFLLSPFKSASIDAAVLLLALMFERLLAAFVHANTQYNTLYASYSDVYGLKRLRVKKTHHKVIAMAEESVSKTAATKFTMTVVWQIAVIVLIAVLAASILTKGFSFTGAATGALTQQQAADKTVAYVNALLQGQATATVENITEANGLYRIQLNVGSQNFDAYMTKDGSLLFPSAIDMTEPLPSAANTTSNTSSSGSYPKSAKPVVQFFVMAFCPYGQQAEAGLIGAWQALGSAAEWEPHYVIYSNYSSASYCLDENQTYCSMHGRQELNEDIRQMCIWDNYNASVWWNYVSKINSQCTSQNVDTCWLGVANTTGINATLVSACQTNEAVALLEAEKQLNEELGVSGSPTVFINDQSYSGGRSADAFKNAICSAFTTAPSACNQTLNSTAGAATGGCGG